MQFAFFESYYEALKELDPKTQAGVLMAMCQFYFEDTEPETSGLVRSIYTLIRPVLYKSKIRAEVGQRGGEASHANKQTDNKSEANDKQNGSKTEANEEQTDSKREAAEKEKKNQKEKKDKDIEKDKEYRARVREIGFQPAARSGRETELKARSGTVLDYPMRDDDMLDVMMDL